MQSKMQPSDAQVEVASHFIERTANAPESHCAGVEFEMDDHGAMYVYFTEDELTMYALFDRSGAMYGDWFV